ncbi:MAG: phage tail protein [Anaerolineae bacterium]|nr:phage tail protein [Anaerolineae bacterium]
MPFLQHDRKVWENLGESAKINDLSNYEFDLRVEGKLEGIFYGLTGGDMTIAKMEYNLVFESGLSTTLYIPGATTFHPFTLTRGFGLYEELYNWFMEASNGLIIQARRSGSVTMCRSGRDYLHWDFHNAWPIKLSGFSYNQYTAASSARIAITIAAETIELKPV